MTWSVIHVFNNGKTQLIGEGINKTVASSKLKNLAAVINELYSFRPQGNDSPNKFHVITIANGFYGDYTPKDVSLYDSWRVKYDEMNSSNIELLVAEIVAFS